MRKSKIICLTILLIISLFCSMISTITPLAATSVSHSGSNAIADPTPQQIANKYIAIRKASSRYSTRPSVVSPFSAGSLTTNYINSGLDLLNFIRYQAKLPEVTTTSALNTDAQYAALVLGALDTGPSHSPKQPSGMSSTMYQKGYNAAASSCLFSLGWGSSVTADYINEYRIGNAWHMDMMGYMNDSSGSNAKDVGHRRWLLNPPLKYVGMGEADGKKGSGIYSSIKVTDTSGTTPNYDFIAWPASGNMLTEVFGVEAPWSVSVNPSKYQVPSLSNIKVVLTRKSDNKSWTFTSSTNQTPNGSTPYIRVDTQGKGIKNCIIFRPDYSVIDTEYSGNWTVRITGLKLKNGTSTEISYTTKFFSVRNYCNHQWGDPDYITYNSCDRYQTCKLCGATQYYDTAHRWLGRGGKSPTCTEAGYENYHCYRCNSDKTETLPAIGHAWGSTTTVKPTCENAGYTSKTCSRCKKEERTVLPATGHRWSVVEILMEPTEDEHGQAVYECSVCQKQKTANLCASEVFTDVPGTSNWAHKGIDYVFIKGLFSGTSDTQFAPKMNTTRSMVVTVLYRLAGKPSVDGLSNPFSDVTTGSWYTNAVIWAVNAGITSGTSDTKFSPNTNVTREQFVTFLYRYAQHQGLELDDSYDNLANYKDINQISGFALNPVAWALNAGIINGTSDTEITPQGLATREQVATMLMRFDKWMENANQSIE